MYQELKHELDEFPALEEGKELTMTDVLQLPDNLRLFLTWMMRQKVVPPEAVAKYIEKDFFATLELIGQLVKKGLIEEAGQTEDNEKQFTVSVRSSRNFRVPDKIWKVFDE